MILILWRRLLLCSVPIISILDGVSKKKTGSGVAKMKEVSEG
jgi:hypothetical protein